MGKKLSNLAKYICIKMLKIGLDASLPEAVLRYPMGIFINSESI